MNDYNRHLLSFDRTDNTLIIIIISLSCQLHNERGAHLEELHGVVSHVGEGGGAYVNGGRVNGAGAEILVLRFLARQGLEVQEIGLVVHLVELKGHLHKLAGCFVAIPHSGNER